MRALLSPAIPRLLIGATCWRRICAELDRVLPCEGLAIPLVALNPAETRANPCTMIELDQLREVIIARAVLVPDRLQLNGWARVSVLPRTDGVVNREVEAEIRRHPSLRACGYLHSHPFARGRTWPSGGPAGDITGHIRPLLEHNRCAGLDTSFSFIACREEAGPGWRLQGFALDRHDRIVDLGFARVLEERSPLLARALQPALKTRSPFRYLLRRWRRELGRRRLHPRQDELFGGWLRFIVRVEPDLELVILLPNSYPEQPAQYYTVRRASGRRASVRRLEPRDGESCRPDAWVRLIEQVEEESHGRA
jgi:hypothetical protein